LIPLALALLLAGAPEDAPRVLRVTSQPSWARVTVKQGGKVLKKGRAPLRVRATGPVEVEVRYKGKDKERRVVAADVERAHFCLDAPRQLVTCERILKVGVRPKSVAFRPGTNELWVALFRGRPTLQVWDIDTGKRLASMNVKNEGAVEMAFTRDGGTVYVSQLERGVVLEVDAEAREVKRTMSVKGDWPKIIVLSPDETKLYASNWRSHDVSELDLKAGEVARRFKTTRVPRGLHVEGGQLFVAGYYKGELDVVDLASGKVKRVYDEGDSLRHVVGGGPGGSVLVSDMGTYEVLRVDPESHAVERLVKTDPNPNTIALSPDGKLLFVSSRGKNDGDKGESWLRPGPTWGSVLIYDVETGKKLDAIVAGNQTTGLAVSPDGARIAFSDFLDDRVRVHRVPDLETLRKGPGRVRTYRRELKKSAEVRAKEDEARRKIGERIRARRAAREAKK
jgi:DNA-binding beta-propeller fold protein YncE